MDVCSTGEYCERIEGRYFEVVLSVVVIEYLFTSDDVLPLNVCYQNLWLVHTGFQ